MSRLDDQLPPQLGETNSILDFMSTHRLFSSLPKDALVQLASEAREREYQKGHYLYYAGDRPDHQFLLGSGLVALLEHDSSGKAYPMLIYFPGDSIGLAAVVLGHRRSLTARATTNSKVIILARESFLHLYDSFPAFAHEVTRELYRTIAQGNQAVLRITKTPVTARVAGFLLEYAAGVTASGREQDSFPIDLSREEMALLLRTSRETVTRVLAELSRKGIVTIDRHRVSVHRPELLQHLAAR